MTTWATRFHKTNCLSDVHKRLTSGDTYEFVSFLKDCCVYTGFAVENLTLERERSQMGLLENLTNTLKQGWAVAKEKGELGARVGRLRLELLRLEREREGQFARLGKSYHNNPADAAALEPLRLEIARLTQSGCRTQERCS
jgi:hypothetical protein